jgi:hypothetical protein
MLDRTVGSDTRETLAAHEDEGEGGREGHPCGQESAAYACGRVTNDRDRLHDGAGSDLPSCDRAQKLRTRHPAIGNNGVVCMSGTMTKPSPYERAPTLRGLRLAAGVQVEIGGAG